AFEDQDTFYAANGKPLPSLPGVPTLAGRIAAVGSTDSSNVHEITLFDAKTGAQLAVVQVGTSGQTFALAAAYQHWVVFRTGRPIPALNTQSHRVLHLTQTSARPIDLAVVGRRIAWAENHSGHGRIRTLELPH